MDNMQYLGNDTVHQLLINLTKDEAISFRKTIEQTLEDFSTGGERQYQPDPNAVIRPNGSRTLFRPFTSNQSIGAKLVVEPPPRPDGKKDPLHGILILMDGLGNPTGVLGAEEVTGYRTSMNVMVPFSWRKNVGNIVIFGGGMQALWHTRLILTLRGSEVKSITFVNPFKDQVDALIGTVSKENAARWKSACSFHFINTSAPDFQQQIETRLSDIDCVFCTTPSRKPLFPASYLTKRKSSARQPFISAIGSWQSDMIELDPALLHHGNAADGGYNPVTSEAKGVVLVDDRDYALLNSGEVVQSELTAEEMVEIGQIVALRSGKLQSIHPRQVEQTNRFISEGFIVYKSIGVSLTDLTAANAVLALRQKKKDHHL
jgi:ornithine cyclodeaminase/alanine dehydrogenase-like protein (mu-crystallin family)